MFNVKFFFSTIKTCHFAINSQIAYYFLIPVVAVLMGRVRRVWHVCAVAVLSALGVVWMNTGLAAAQLLSAEVNHTTMSFARCLPIFAMGSLAAFFYKRLLVDFDLVSKYLAAARSSRSLGYACALLQLLVIRLPHAYPLAGNLLHYYNNALLLAAHLLLMVCAAPNVLTEWLAACVPLRVLGKYSFGVYLFHQSVMWTVMRQLAGSRVPLVSNVDDQILISMSLSLLVGYLFYHTVERHTIRVAQWVNSNSSHLVRHFSFSNNNNTNNRLFKYSLVLNTSSASSSSSSIISSA